MTRTKEEALEMIQVRCGRQGACAGAQVGGACTGSQLTGASCVRLAVLQAFRRQIETGEVSFGDLAARESHCSSARAKGDLGFFEHGQMQVRGCWGMRRPDEGFCSRACLGETRWRGICGPRLIFAPRSPAAPFMQRAFEEATAALQVGELSQPVFSDSGVHLIHRTA